jgi:ADP-ribose pyrophosphatase YjhB (NUDIX family)
VRRDGTPHGQEWALPGTFLHEEETLADAVLRSREQKAGLRGTTPRQLRVFDDPNRDDRGWVLSVAHVVVLPWETVSSVVGARPDGVSLRPVTEASGLPIDHDAMVRLAVTELQAAHRERPDPEGLLPEPFTLRQLRKLHETVLDERLVPDTFRRHVLP